MRRYEPYEDGALKRSSQPAAHLAWTETILQHAKSNPTDPNWSQQHVHPACSKFPTKKWPGCKLTVWHSIWKYTANQHRLKTPWCFNMFKLKWHSASGTPSALHGHHRAKLVRAPASALRRCIVAVPPRVKYHSQSFHFGWEMTPCQQSKKKSTNPQTLNHLQKTVQLCPAAITAVRNWNVICPRKHIFIIFLWACRCLSFEEVGPMQENS